MTHSHLDDPQPQGMQRPARRNFSLMFKTPCPILSQHHRERVGNLDSHASEQRASAPPQVAQVVTAS
jgi:hypothetical protein